VTEDESLRRRVGRWLDLVEDAQTWLDAMFANPGGQSGPRAHAITRLRELHLMLTAFDHELIVHGDPTAAMPRGIIDGRSQSVLDAPAGGPS
jgi:hypothetical protein